ncbi:MAG: S-layer homology domain-containing protein [Selenomonadaceae bacterium]|nr:S-layer homology domain-containing protein [Selenomonadaceae bacterium]
MKLSKKTLAILAGLTIGMSGSAFAASADSFTDVPKDHWAYQALDYLAQEGVIDGMGDSTFQGGRSMTRYEMAAIVAKAMQKNPTNIGDQAVLEKLEGEFGTEIKRLTKRVDAHDKAIKELQDKTDKFKVWGMTRVQMGRDNGLQKYTSSEGDVTNGTWLPNGDDNFNKGRNGDYNNRFYMDLEGSMKVNDHATARFTIEKNARYRDSEARRYVRVTGNGTSNGAVLAVLPAASHMGNDTDEMDTTHNGSVSNIWVELQLGKKHDWYTNIGRKWNGIGMQNLMLGGVVDGIQTYHPIEKGHGWWFSAQYYQGASNWHEEGTVNQDALQNAFDKVNFQSVDAYNDSLVASWKTSSGLTYTGAKAKDAYSYDANLKQMVADQTNLQAARAAQKTWASNNGFGDQYWAQTKTPVSDFSKLDATTQADLLANSTKYTAGRAPVIGLVNFWGPLGKYIDANIAFGKVVDHDDIFYMKADRAYGIDLKVKMFKDFAVTTSLVKTNAKADYLPGQSHNDRDLAVRMDYRGTDLNKVGSWGLWAKWQQLGAFGDFGHDDEWSTREPTYTNGTKGWLMGFNCVPWKNVEWGTLYGNMRENFGDTTWSGKHDYKRNILRTWLDFHF